jgi:FkbM family methyltransferase
VVEAKKRDGAETLKKLKEGCKKFGITAGMLKRAFAEGRKKKMKIRRLLAGSNILRRLFFPLLSLFDFEIRIRHDITNRPFHLLSWRHKGYWFHGRSREENEITFFRKLIKKGHNVLEIGGHIGYVTQYFEHLVGDKGRVIVAEPTPQSRKLLTKNVHKNTVILPVAASDSDGEMDFFVEEFGGFTNSLEQEFTETTNISHSDTQHKNNAQVRKIKVDVRSTDSICEELGLTPDFIKIDVEGAELRVLRGATGTLRSVESLMVEVSRHHELVYELLMEVGFQPYDSQGNAIQDGVFEGGNIFFSKNRKALGG